MRKVDKGLHVADKVCIFLYNLLVCWGDEKFINIFDGIPEGKRPLGDLGRNLKIIFRWILQNIM